MMDKQVIPTKTRKRRSALKRQRAAVLIVLCVAILLGATLGVISSLTSRILVKYPNGDKVLDADGTKYYAVMRDGEWVMKSSEGDYCERTSEGLFATKDGTLVSLNESTGEPTVVAAVMTEGTEQAYFDATTGGYDILLYPLMERERIGSIRVVNVHTEYCNHDEEKEPHTHSGFAFVRDGEGNFVLEGHPTTNYDSVMFSTLVVVTGYTTTTRRLEIGRAFEKGSDGAYLYPEYENFRQNGYAEYGLPENAEDATSYFVITDTTGEVSHKIIVGDVTPDDQGFYVRYNDREEVYVLKQMEASEYNATLSDTLYCPIEDYVTPTVTAVMSSDNYFDVEGFTLKEHDTSTNTSKTLAKFSYIPLEKRIDTYYASIPYQGEDILYGYGINDYQVDLCLMNLMELAASRTVKLYADDGDTGANMTDFISTFGLGYTIEFDFVGSRYGEEGNYRPVPSDTIEHYILVSPLTKNADGKEVYYLYTDIFDMSIEVERNYLSFLQWSAYDWIKPEIFDGNILFLEKMEVSAPGGTHAGLVDVKFASFLFEYYNADGQPVTSTEEEAEMRVFATYNGMVNVPVTDTLRFRYFYQSMLYSTLADAMPKGSDEAGGLQSQLKAKTPDLTIKLTFDIDGEETVKTYRFYFGSEEDGTLVMNGRGAYMTLELGNAGAVGHSYMMRYRVEKLINDLGRALSDNPDDVITPDGKK